MINFKYKLFVFATLFTAILASLFATTDTHTPLLALLELLAIVKLDFINVLPIPSATLKLLQVLLLFLAHLELNADAVIHTKNPPALSL